MLCTGMDEGEADDHFALKHALQKLRISLTPNWPTLGHWSLNGD